MNERITKKTVLITGGVRGIGLAIAKAFLEKGYDVYATYSKDEESAKNARNCGIFAVRSDIRKEEEIVRLFEQIGKVDILVNNAGVSLIKQIQDTTAKDLDELFSVNVRGAILCAREAAKGMIDRRSGLIVNISSVWGEVGASCETAYSASKAAIIGFTKALAKELGYSNIRVCCVSPGVIDTRMNEHFSQEDLSLIQEEIPMGRLGKSEEIAKTVVFLEENDYITGVDIPVNGGFSVC
jgi:3-oxoacyl-[acyl-carrier protein] reductase